MATFQTKFAIGDKVCTIDKKTLKVKRFTVDFVSLYVHSDGAVSVSYRAEGEGFAGDSYEEPFVFANESDLMKYVTTNEA